MTDDITLDAPETRLERFLAAAAGVEGITLDEPVTRIEKYLYKIAQGGGSGLPEVTSADNGKVLTVADGAWAAGKSVYIVECDGYNSPLSGSEISAIAESGIYPVLHYSDRYWLYTAKNVNTAYFIELRYEKVSQQYFARFASVSSTKIATKGSSEQVYMLPSNGIPETDLAQAVKDKLNKFIVTLTPTAQDLSGTMDKTPQEITAAYNAGQEIVFSIPSMNAQLTPVQFLETADAIIASAHIIYNLGNGDVMIAVTTHSSASTYSTNIYALTPAT